MKKLRAAFVERLREAHEELSDVDKQDLVLQILRADLKEEINEEVDAHRQAIVDAFENWWEKYRVTLEDISEAQSGAEARLADLLEGLGYAG